MADEFLGGFGIPPELAKALAKFLNRANDPVDSPNPTRYPRHTKIVDGDVNVMLTEYERLNEKVDLLRNEADEVDHTRSALVARIYRECNRLYREIVKRGDMESAGSGLRKWKGEFYIVGWDTTKEEDEKE